MKAKFDAKAKERLTPSTSLNFNGCQLIQTLERILLCQKEQAIKIKLIDFDSLDMNKSYIEKRAREAYIASICQPEASLDTSIVAQNQNPDKNYVLNLNKRLKLKRALTTFL